jgi:hypothetical protein
MVGKGGERGGGGEREREQGEGRGAEGKKRVGVGGEWKIKKGDDTSENCSMLPFSIFQWHSSKVFRGKG